MSLKNNINAFLDNLRFISESKRRSNNLDEKLKTIPYYEGTDSEFEEVLKFWKRYDYKPSKKWYQYYGYYDNRFDYNYIPEDFFYKKLYPILNKPKFDNKFKNRIIIHQLLNDIEKPKTLIRYANKIFLDENGNMISKEDCIKFLSDYEILILKFAVKSKEKDQILLNIKSDGIEIFKNLILEEEFLIQEIVQQNSQMNSFTNCNWSKVHVNSLLVDSKVEIISTFVECKESIEKSKNDYLILLNQNGDISDKIVKDYAIARTSRNQEMLIAYDKIIEIIKKIHPRLAHARIINWMFAINEENNAVFLDLDTEPYLNQRVLGPLFKENTNKILDEYLQLKKEGKIR